MTRVSQTDVVYSSHIASTTDCQDTATEDPDYEETEVTATERTVTFINNAQLTDNSILESRRVRIRAHATGHGIDTYGEWIPYDYYDSPKTKTPYECDVEVDVPDLNLPYYDFSVTTQIQIDRNVNNEWLPFVDREVGYITARVNDDSAM